MENQEAEKPINKAPQLEGFTYQQVEILKKEAIWRNLAEIPLKSAIAEWLDSLPALTSKNYKSGIKMLAKLGILILGQNLQNFALINHDAVLDRIKGIKELSEGSRQARAALYISLTRFLSRRTEGMIKKAIPSKEGTSRTFWKIRDKVVAEALSRNEWEKLVKAMESINKRDALIVKLCLQGARRIGEVLGLRIEKIDLKKREALFTQSKTKGMFREVVVNLPGHLADELEEYVGERKEGMVFITGTGGKVGYTQIWESIRRGSRLAGIHKRVHPHVLRTSTITYLRGMGFQDFEVQRLTGHSSSQMLNAYDKIARGDNVSKRVALV